MPCRANVGEQSGKMFAMMRGETPRSVAACGTASTGLGSRQADSCRFANGGFSMAFCALSQFQSLSNRGSLQSYGEPLPVLLHVDPGKPVVAAIILPVLHAPLNRTSGYNCCIAIYTHFQIEDLPRVVMERSRCETFKDLLFRAHLAA